MFKSLLTFGRAPRSFAAALALSACGFAGHAGAAPISTVPALTIAGERSFDAHLTRVQHHRPRASSRVVRRGRSNGGAAVAAGVAGLVIGGLIASQAQARPRYQTYETYGEPAYAEPGYAYEPQYDERQYVPQQRLYAEPVEQRSVVQQSYGFQPWTPEWYDYCSRRYRSFDPRSGTFMGYNGLRQMC